MRSVLHWRPSAGIHVQGQHAPWRRCVPAAATVRQNDRSMFPGSTVRNVAAASSPGPIVPQPLAQVPVSEMGSSAVRRNMPVQQLLSSSSCLL